jgi:CBS domain-containing protein
MKGEGMPDDPTVNDIMTRKLVILSPDMDIYEAMRTLIKKGISGAPVIDDDGNLLGILSEYDCLKVLTAGAYEGLPEGKVADYMTCPATTVKPTASLIDVVTLFTKNPIRRIPVMDKGGQLLGLISRRDVLVAIESIRGNTRLYGAKEETSLPPSSEDGIGVDSAIKYARGKSGKK